MTSAIGFPNRVTRIGFFVLRTWSSKARHFALNSEMATSRINPFIVSFFYHSHIKWSIVDSRCSRVAIMLLSSSKKPFSLAFQYAYRVSHP